jgi:hypothetical protein
MNNFSLLKIRPRQRLATFCCVALLSLLTLAEGAHAQSQDISSPTPVSTNQISGQITARDIGDARLTRHFYILTGTPGDFILTVTSNNLNGDVDLFTAGSLRPLGKVSMYAGSTQTSVGKTIFLRQRESLILRIEARSPNDNEGTYSVRFAGTFEPVMAAQTSSEESATDSTQTRSAPSDRNVRRVTSSGARIEEPETEATASTETTATPADSEPATATPSPTPVEPTTTARTRRPGRRRARATPQPSGTSEPSTETRSNDSSPAEAAASPRLIIETRDGMRSERLMSTVRSVTIENGQILIISRERGKSMRIPLATVLKMSIEP